jgi:hypothetical protein
VESSFARFASSAITFSPSGFNKHEFFGEQKNSLDASGSFDFGFETASQLGLNDTKHKKSNNEESVRRRLQEPSNDTLDAMTMSGDMNNTMTTLRRSSSEYGSIFERPTKTSECKVNERNSYDEYEDCK